MQKEAQVPGGAGMGTPGGAPAGGVGMPNEPIPAGAPSMDNPIQSITTDEEADKGDEDTAVGEQMVPGSICPFCRSTDTTVGAEGREPDVFECNSCKAVYRLLRMQPKHPNNFK
mgnify:CR=1 FL=1